MAGMLRLLDFFGDSWMRFDLRPMFNAMVDPLVQLAILLNPLPEYHLTKEPMDGNMEMRYIEETFDNWGTTILNNVTVRTFFPRTVEGVQNIVKLAREQGSRVRASGTRHTFNPWLWGLESEMQPGEQGRNVDFIIATIPLEVSDHLAYARDLGTWPEDSELVGIQGPLSVWEEDGKKHASARFMAGTLNLHYMDWALANNWTLSSNTIMQYMSMGGVMMGTCHGGGIQHGTMGDKLLEVEYVDAKGDLITITDPEDIRVFGGSMGMLGIVTAFTYRLDEMSYARYQPQHIKGGLEAFLPHPDSADPIPESTIESMMHYYSEYIQYPTHHNASGVLWKQTWDNFGRAEDAVTPLTDHLEDEYQRNQIFLETVANNAFKTALEYFPNEHFLRWIFGWMVGATSGLAMDNFEEPLTTTVMEAMHFRRGLHYLSVKAAELIVPIPELEDGSPDWRVVQQVWWDMEDVVARFESEDKYPVDLAVEDRFMGGSEMLLAANHGNKYSIAIEVASSPLVDHDLWEEFKEAIADNWGNYRDRSGNQLRVRPHWAKEFPRRVGGVPINDYMRQIYAPQLPAYVQGMRRLVEQKNNGELSSTLAMFNTKYMENILDGYL